jgi:hypothetical protein
MWKKSEQLLEVPIILHCFFLKSRAKRAIPIAHEYPAEEISCQPSLMNSNVTVPFAGCHAERRWN